MYKKTIQAKKLKNSISKGRKKCKEMLRQLHPCAVPVMFVLFYTSHILNAAKSAVSQVVQLKVVPSPQVVATIQ